ncbi:MAG: gluconolaconase [Deltaproteobacteria bacterium]|nr:MAG: gluconolaconase [Deltaproteobacteria bacterium]
MRTLSAFALAILASLPAAAWNRGQVTTFAVLPAGATGPEGIEVDSAGNVYVATFGFNAQGAVGGEGQLYVFDDEGMLVRQVSVAGSTSHLLGLRFQPRTHKLLVIDFGGAKVFDVDPTTGASKVFMTVPDANAAGLNDITFDKEDNVYVSDSFQGIVWKTGQQGGMASSWVADKLLTTTGYPPFGANGLRFNKKEDALFVANTGDDTIIKIPVTAGSPGKAQVFTESINGADGVIVDEDDNLWVAANQADEIVVVDPTGKAISKLGDFDGIRAGSPIHLLFPASLRFLGESLVVTNLALDLRVFGLPQSVDSQWCAQVSRYTISKVSLRHRE